jgi:hypothetical protein
MERRRTIFEDLENFTFNGNLVDIIKFNSYFKKLGFERVNMCETFSTNTYYPQITLMIRPELMIPHDSDNQDLSLTIWNVQRGDVQFELWGRYFGSMEGYSGMNSHRVIKKSKEPIKDMIITFEGKELILGQYLPERNVVLLYINPFNTELGKENNTYLETCLKVIEDTTKVLELKKNDVSEKMKLIVIENFKKEIKHKVESIKDNLQYSENQYSNLNRQIVALMRNLEVQKKELNGLVALSSNTDEVIKKELDEVKKLSFVKEAILTNEGIFLDVGKIFIRHKEENVYIGEFYISIKPDEIKIICKNPILDKDNMEVQHPHINDKSDNCFGDGRRRKINEHLANFELKKLTIYLNLFLKSYTPDDCYNSLSMWVRPDLKRRRKRIQIKKDNINMEFEGSYFSDRNDRGDNDSHYDEDNDDDDNSDDDDDNSDDDNNDDVYDDDGNRI